MARTGGWQGSTRHARLPADWPARRVRVLRQQPTCRLAYDCCTTVSTEVDHITAGDDHRYANLQGVCSPCHARKSAGEGTAAHRAKGWATTRRAPEPHPGLTTPAQRGTQHTHRADQAGAGEHDASAQHDASGEASNGIEQIEPDRPPRG
jgi:5-methylcytosine-specific restriction protein A